MHFTISHGFSSSTKRASAFIIRQKPIPEKKKKPLFKEKGTFVFDGGT
jgi:hypothetical protein